MPRFGFHEDLEDSENDSQGDEIEPMHPIGFGSSSSIPFSSDLSSPWGKTWISLDPPSRSAYSNKTGRSTYAFDEEEDLHVQSYPPLSSFLRADQVSTTALLRLDQPRKGGYGSYREPSSQYGYETDEDDLYYSGDDDDDDNSQEEYKSNENYSSSAVELLFRSPTKTTPNSDRLVSALQEALSPDPYQVHHWNKVELNVQKRIQAEQQRIASECSQMEATLREIVLESNKEAEAILQKRKAEEERIRKAQTEQEERERKLQEAQEKARAAQKQKEEAEEAEAQAQVAKKEQAQKAKEAQLQQAKIEQQEKAKKATEHIDKAKKLVGQLVQVRASVEPFEKNKAVGKRRLGMKKIAKGKVNTLTDNASKIREVATEIVQAIGRYDQEDAQIKQQLKQGAPGLTPDMAVGRRYFVDLLASTVMTRVQAESFSGPKGDSFPLAAMIAMVSLESKHIVAVLAAHIFTVCPTAIPTLPSVKADATEDEIMTGIGMQRNAKTGEFESYPQFLARTENIISFMAAVQSSLPTSHQVMGGNTGAILWLKRFLDLLPAETSPLPLITAPVLGAFLNGAGHMLANVHGEKFQKLFGIIQNDIVNRLDEGAIGKPSAIRLNKILEGGIEGFLKNLPSKAIPELYCGASANSAKKETGTISFGGTIGGKEEVKEKRPLQSAQPSQNPFGGSNNTTNQNPFGQASGNSSTGNNPFGGGGGFGNGPNTTQPSPSFGSGGNNNNAINQSPFGNGNASSPSPFGGGNNNVGQNPSPFGGGGMAPSPSPFGGGNVGMAPSAFGNTSGAMAPSPLPFGSAAPSPSPFGGGMAPSPSPFGAAPASVQSSSPFGGGNIAPSPSPFGGGGMAPSPSPFGGSAAVSQSPFGGGSNNAAPFGSSFGGMNNNANASSFGGSNPSPFGGGMQQSSPFGGGQAKKKGPCRFFAQGKCRKGDSCPYSHETGGRNNNSNNSSGFGSNSSGGFGGGSNSSPFGANSNNQSSGFGGGGGFGSNNNNEGGKKGPCRFFAQGRCRKGNDCPYSHETGGNGGNGFGGGGGFGSNNWNSFGRRRR